MQVNPATGAAVRTTDEPRFWTGKRKRLYGLVASAAAIYVAASSLGDWRESHKVLINTTTSLPNWAFVLDH